MPKVSGLFFNPFETHVMRVEHITMRAKPWWMTNLVAQNKLDIYLPSRKSCWLREQNNLLSLEAKVHSPY